VKVKVYVEGGGDHNNALETACRRGFSEFFRKAGFRDRMPKVIRCGSREQAYDRFREACKDAPAEFPVLLVDSETPVADVDPWEHVRLRKGDEWLKPAGAEAQHLHFMVQTMEAWFHADKAAVGRYFGQGFKQSALRPRVDIDNIPKADLLSGLQAATRDCARKGEYSKGEHSFELLALIDPEKVKNSSPNHAGRLLAILDEKCRPPANRNR
jgi:hypothetical protein